MDLAGWLSIAALCASGAVSPGPSLAVVVKNTVASGRSGGVVTAVGHGIGVGLYAFVAMAGLTTLTASLPAAHRVLEVGGGLFLIVLGLRALRGGPSGEEKAAPEPARGFVEGFLVAFLNPKIAVWFLALLGSFVPVEASWGTRTGVAGLAMAIDMGWYSLVAVGLARTGGDRWLAAHERGFDVVTGGLLVALGLGVLLW